MQFLSVVYLKIVPAGGDLDAADEREVYGDNENVSFLHEGRLIKKILSGSPNASGIVEDGDIYTMRLRMGDGDLDDYAMKHGGTHAAGIYTKTQGTRELGLFDMRLGVKRVDNAVALLDLTDMFILPKSEHNLKDGNQLFLAIEAEASKTTGFTWDNSAT